jgi:hypothetical protein
MDIPAVIQHWPLQAVAAVVAGVVILLAPRVLNYAVAAYLLVIGAIGLSHSFYGQAIRPQALIAVVAGILILIKPSILSYVVGIYLILLGLLESGIIRF